MTVFKVMQLAIVGVFTFFVSDIRKKKGMNPLISKTLCNLMKICYLIPIVMYGHLIVTLDDLLIFDFVALGLTWVGMVLAAKAKTDLGEYHTWVGYGSEGSKLVTDGIFSYIRHPLYTGVYVLIIGGLFTIIPHASRRVTAIVLITLTYVMAVIALAASRETEFLAKQFADEFEEYRRQVHPFLPIRKFNKLRPCRTDE